jgi:hypothetical protein
MATYLLVAGAWLGGWAWDGVAPSLRDRGRDVHPLTLSGSARSWEAALAGVAANEERGSERRRQSVFQ